VAVDADIGDGAAESVHTADADEDGLAQECATKVAVSGMSAGLSQFRGVNTVEADQETVAARQDAHGVAVEDTLYTDRECADMR
jgi:hypothetical protein